MRNLVFLSEKRRSITVDSKDCRISDFCLVPSDEHGENTVLLTASGLVVFVDSSSKIVWTCNLAQECSSDTPNFFQVTSCDLQIVCLSTCGAIVTLSQEGEAELVGEFDHGIDAACWSPDQQVLALVTRVESGEDNHTNSVLLTMNTEWQVMQEVTIEQHLTEEEVSLCWRPDATLCAVSSVDVSDNVRRIRTYQRESLQLHSIGRAQDGSGQVVPNLYSPLTWTGGACSNLITSIQKKGKSKTQVVFFEPNGLRHREFILRESQAKVFSLDWNVESDLLAVTFEKKIQLWHRSNYHWYLKQEVCFAHSISRVFFDDERPYKLHVALCGDGSMCWRELHFCWDTSTLYKESTAISIDGALLNMTPLNKALVPPPMYAASIEMPHTIREVAFCRSTTCSIVGVVSLSDGSLTLLQNSTKKSAMIANYCPPAVLCHVKWKEESDINILSLRHVLVMDSNDTSVDMIVITTSDSGDCDLLVELRVEWTMESSEATVSVINSIALEGRILRMVHWSDYSQGALLELDDGCLLEYSQGEVLPSPAEPLLEPCPWIRALHQGRLVVGLSSRLRLYCHDRLLQDSASSFILSPSHGFLSFATADPKSVLKFLPLEQLASFDPLLGSDENFQLEGYEPRHVERGTRLVALCPQEPMAVLQMPRGNLEGIYPRAVMLPYCMSLIHSQQFGEALTLMRRQKVDLNLIVDLDPTSFLKEGIHKFVNQVDSVEYLNLFISCLQNGNVTEFRYRIPTWLAAKHPVQSTDNDFDFGTKINQICQSLRSILIEAEQNGKTAAGRAIVNGHFLLPILSTFAKEDPPQLEEALTLIKENSLASHPPNSRKPPLFAEGAQSSIQYLAFLADYKLLFNTALGMYDYDLARAVARNSQMDPKVYLALLKRLKSCPIHYGRFEVDVRLERYESALSNLVRSGEESEDVSEIPPCDDDETTVGNDFSHCMALIESQGLHRLGLKLFEANAERRRHILLSLGEHLLDKRQAQTALAVFLAAEPPHLEGARKAARKCGDWRFFFTLANDGGVGDESTELCNRRIAHEIAEEIASGQFGITSKRTGLVEAARILLDYSQDVVGSVDMLVSAEMWSEARRIASLHSRPDLVRKCVESCTSYAYSCLEDFEERTKSFSKANERYIEVLKIRKAVILESGLAPGEEHEANLDDTGSQFSMASNASLGSTMSGSSVGSVSSSISSVISVGAQSSFTIKTSDGVHKHRSKFNKLGKAEKKKKKKWKNKIRPGSEEELNSLVGTLKSSCVDSEYCSVIGETIEFLGQVGKVELGREVFGGYNAMKGTISSIQQERIDVAKKEKEEHERRARREGVDEPYMVLGIEGEVDSLACNELPDTLHVFFSYM